jgi:uncharacterized protein DUF5989
LRRACLDGQRQAGSPIIIPAELPRRKTGRGRFVQNIRFQELHPMGVLQDMKSRFSIFGELWAFMKVRKKWWLGPIMIFLVLLGVLIVFTEGSALAPFIYALF